MEFTDELLKKLAEEGINWDRESDGTLTYTSNYEHVSATVHPSEGYFVLTNECRDPSDVGVLCERSFRNQFDHREPQAEDILREVAEACGRIDQGIEDAMNVLCGYDIKEY
jgi:hypothetical protein